MKITVIQTRSKRNLFIVVVGFKFLYSVVRQMKSQRPKKFRLVYTHNYALEHNGQTAI
jgi:hypothetical protein